MVKLRIDFAKSHLKGRKILDVGNLGDDEYDKGSVHSELRRMFSNVEFTGLDSNQDKARLVNFPGQVLGNAEDMPFSDNFFDSIYMGEIIEHTFEPKKMLTEAYRTLKQGGVLVLDTPNPYALSRILRFVIKRKDTIGHPDHKIFYTPAVLENILIKVGFRIEIMTTDSSFGIKGVNLYLPRVKLFNMLGGHICLKAIKE